MCKQIKVFIKNLFGSNQNNPVINPVILDNDSIPEIVENAKKLIPMTLSKKQGLFLLNVAKLIIWINEQGWYATGGELLRTKEQQQIYFDENKSKTMDSDHLKKLAIDLNLFINGVYQTNKEAYKPLADYWKSLNENNVAGYDWGWDANHFSMK